MGNVNALSAQNQLNEIARMAYGSGKFFEGTSGGKGNIGLITGADGKPRVIKFNTHYGERGGVATADQIKSANALRAQLLSIAKTLNPGVVAELRAKLGLGAGEDVSAGQTLLTRKIVAAAVKLINANGMTTAMEGVNAESLKSTGGTKFEEASVYATYGVSAKTLKACNMSTADFTESVNAVAEKFHLSDAKKQAVGRATASWLTALAEEGKTGKPGQEGLPSKDKLKRQISEGSFGGTYWGLAHVRAFSTKIPPLNADDELFYGQSLDLSSSLSDDECADAAYFIAKMGTGKRGKTGYDNWLLPLAVKTLVDRRTELMALHQRNGTLSINDMWNVLVGRDAPENIREGSASDFSKAVGQKLLDKITQDHPEEARRRWRGNYTKFDESLRHMMTPVINFGVSVDVAVKLYFDEDVGDIQCSHTASAYDVTSDEYKRADAAKLTSVISGDINRIEGECSIRVVNGDDTHHLPIPKMAGEGFANGETPELMKAMNRLVGGGVKIGNPVPNQLKTMCYLCGQAGNSFLSLSGLSMPDHYPVDKSFTLQKDGSVLYTASAEVNGVPRTVQYQIEKDGTSHLVDYSRSTIEEARVRTMYGVATNTLQACGMSAADFEASVDAMAEKFNLSAAQKQAVGQSTASYLAALAEEGKTGQLGVEGLPSKDVLKKQISEGTFGGTYLGLGHVQAFFVKMPTLKSADNQLVDSSLLELSQSMSDDECADAAYFIAKMGTGKRGVDGQRDNALSSMSLKTLVDHRTELMAIRQRNGTLTVNDMWNAIVGKDVPESFASGGTASNFNNSFYAKVLAEIKRDHPAWAEQKNLDDYMDIEFHMSKIMMPVSEFGISLDVGFRLFFGEGVGDVQCSHTASAYDVTSAEYKEAGAQKLTSDIAVDILRIEGNSSIQVGSGKGAYTLDIPKMAGDGFANAETPKLMKTMNHLIGGGDEIGNPVPNQLKTMCYLCGQAGNSFLTLAGLKPTGEGGADHYPVDKSFTRQGDSVLYTGSAEVNGVKHTVQYQIEKDGTSHLVDYSREVIAKPRS